MPASLLVQRLSATAPGLLPSLLAAALKGAPYLR